MRLLVVDEETLKHLSEANLPNYSHVAPTVSDGDHYVELADGDGNH